MRSIYCYITVFTATLLLIGGTALAESANASFDRAFEKHLRGDLAGAVKLYSKAIEDDAAFAMAYQMRGIAQQQLKKYPQAINDFSMVIRYGEPFFKCTGYYHRGIVKNMTGDFAGAIPDFSAAIALDNKMAAAFFHRAIAKSKTADFFGRMEDFREAARLGDVNATAWLNTYYPGWKEQPPAAAAL